MRNYMSFRRNNPPSLPFSVSQILNCGSHRFSYSVPLAVALLGLAIPSVHASSYSFTVSGTGITASGVIQVSNTGPLGAYTIKGITGNFVDTTNNISGAILGLDSAPAPVFNASPPAAPNTFSAPASTLAGFSYDNLFWPGANSPAVCTDALIFSGGFFDVYGMAFDIAGGYTADIWSNGPNLGGYQLNDSVTGSKTPFTPSNFDGLAYAVNVTASPTPEPASLLLLGTALPGLGAILRRKFRAGLR